MSTDLEHRLVSVSGSSPTDLWAVGTRFTNENDRGELLIEHWDGQSWTAFATPVDPRSGALTDVAAVATDDVWAVGSLGQQEPVILHWDGGRWGVVPSPSFGPSPEHIEGGLDAIAVVSRADIWALGHYVPPIGGESVRRDVFEHWNGTRWSLVSAPQGVDPSVGDGGVQDVAANRNGDVWAVGGKTRGWGEAAIPDGALVDWLGQQGWSSFTPPPGAAPVTLVTVTPSGEVGAVKGPTLHGQGDYGTGRGQNIWRWTGQRWVPEGFDSHMVITGIASAGSQVWFVGRRGRTQQLDIAYVRFPLQHLILGGVEPHRLGPPIEPYELRTPAVTVTREGSVVVLDTDGLPSSGQRNLLYTNCAVASGGGQS